MKKVYLFAAAALALASCSDDFTGGTNTTVQQGNGEISFSSHAFNPTRAEITGSQAAAKLNNNFIVYGFKTNGAETTDGTKTNDEKVFDLYNVNYKEGTAHTTESNTAGWEYVGLTPHTGSSATEQTIKYWDYATAGYVFSAVSGIGITATKAESAVTGTEFSMTNHVLTVNGTATNYDKGWKVEIPAGGDLSTLYASDRKVVAKANYNQQVGLTFRSLVTKIRFAMYETIPGYEVKIKNLYYNTLGTANSTNFAIDGTFKTVKDDAPTPLYVTYYSEGSVLNRPKVSYNDSDVKSATYGIFGANIQAADHIGTTSVDATYDQSDMSYTYILPYENASNVLNLKVDYTLTSTDGSGETIEVSGATATVPANFNQWKPNFAYTYMFKISDNTNGTTGTGGDPAGLYPITFDAIVITEDNDVQETITSVSNPSITTYQKGVVVTKNDEYVAGDDIYFEDGDANISNYKVYEVHNYGTIEGITEEVVANYLQNFCVLTEVPVTKAPAPVSPATATDFIPLSDGTYIQKGENKAAKFTPEAGKVYVICDEATPTKHYKVVKVAGEETAPSFSLAQTDGSNPITTVAGKTVLTLKQGTVGVIGAKPNFTVTSTNGNKGLVITPTATDGVYDVTVDPAAIYAGKANDTYTVDFQGQTVTITVNIANALSPAAVTVTAGNATGANTTFTIAGALSDDGVIVNENEGIHIVAQGSGVYKVTADADVPYKAAGYDATIGGVALKINVDSYAFASDLVITKALTGTDTGVLTLKKNGSATGVDVAYSALGGNDAIATGADATNGEFTLTAVAGGSFDVAYENAKAKVTVNAYTIAAANASITAPTGSTTLTVKKNGEAINAVAGKVIVTATIPGRGDCVPVAGVDYTLTATGSKLVFKASTAGSYNFTYVEDYKQVAVTTVVAN